MCFIYVKIVMQLQKYNKGEEGYEGKRDRNKCDFEE